jgi:chemotaxis protein methyltransferase CheR
LSEIFPCIPRGAASFFTDKEQLDFLSETVVSDLRAGATLGRPRHVRVWCADCSTGEEAYSIAICLLEALREVSESAAPSYQPGGWRVEVLATDASAALLATATDRIYEEPALREMPAEMVTRYFLRGRGEMAGRVRVKQGLAELVSFRRIRIEDRPWPLEGPFDVIFYRKALACLPVDAQEPILREMLGFLSPHAYLILGATEKAPGLTDAVVAVGHGIHQLRPRGKAKYTGKERRVRSRKTWAPE